MAEPSYLRLIRIHDRIWESDWPQNEREISCQQVANVFGRWKEIEWQGNSNETEESTQQFTLSAD